MLRGRSSTTVSRYVQSPSAAFGLREEEHEPIHRVDLLRRMLLHQQAGEEEKAHHAYLSPENRAFIALPAGAMASKKKVQVNSRGRKGGTNTREPTQGNKHKGTQGKSPGMR